MQDCALEQGASATMTFFLLFIHLFIIHMFRLLLLLSAGATEV